MKNRIYTNIMFKPRIWGFYFTSLFTVLGGFVISLMIFSLVTGMGWSLLLNTILFGAVAGYLFHRDNRDDIEYSEKKSGIIQSRISSYSISDQKIRMGA